MNARPLRLSTAQADFETLFQQRLHWSADTDAAIEQRVADILADVKARGDAAVLDLLYRLPEGSWLTAEDAWDWPLLDAIPEERECRTRIELPDGRVRINSRLAAGGRLCARLVRGTA